MVQEATPDGSVFMKWNEDNESFDYWCDNKEIKYVYLEVVARKYCTMFVCPEIYIDRGKDIQRQKELEKQAEEKLNYQRERYFNNNNKLEQNKVRRKNKKREGSFYIIYKIQHIIYNISNILYYIFIYNYCMTSLQ